MMKYCPRCQQTKPLDAFGNDRSRKDGKFSYCKACANQHQKNVRAAPDFYDRTREYFNEWHELHPDASARYARGYRERNPDKYRETYTTQNNREGKREAKAEWQRSPKGQETRRQWQEKNKETIQAKSQAYHRQHRQSIIERVRNWRKANPEKKQAQDHKRRALKQGSKESFTADEWSALCERYDYRCLCCGKQERLTADHIVPLSKGGSNGIDNIQPLCFRCNSKKGVKTIDYRY